MRKQIFLAIIDRLKQAVPDIKYYDLWNDDLATLSGGKLWPRPAVFVEFEQIDWHQEGRGGRMADITIRLHIVTQAMPVHGDINRDKLTASLAYLDLIDRINAAMQGLYGENFAPMMLITSATNHNHAELIESVERYITRAQDASAITPLGKVVAALNLDRH